MPKKRRHGTPRNLVAQVAPREGGGLALQVGGVTQSISLPITEGVDGADDPRADYWGLMLPPGCPRHALLLGLGGGTVATLLSRRCPKANIVGIERDPTVLTLARDLFGLDTLPRLNIVEADAFDWVPAQLSPDGTLSEGAERFDLICVDLFEAGRLAPGVLATPFLRQIATLLTADGVVTINLMVTGRTPEHLHRLRRVFEIEREMRVRGNLLVHAKALPREQWAHEDRPPIM